MDTKEEKFYRTTLIATFAGLVVITLSSLGIVGYLVVTEGVSSSFYQACVYTSVFLLLLLACLYIGRPWEKK